MSDQTPPPIAPDKPAGSKQDDFIAGKAVLTEAVRHSDIIHTTLAGMGLIVLTLLVAVALPVFGFPPVTVKEPFLVIAAVAIGGIGYLYYLNYKVHNHLGNQARLTEVLVNSLGQGFLAFTHAGNCGRVYSQACLDLLESMPADKPIQDVLRIPEDQRGDFKDWLDILFMPNHALGFDDVIKFLPQFFPHSQERRISLQYKPIREKSGELTHVVVIATDQTDEYEAEQRALERQNYAEMICRIFKERNQFLATLTHVRRFLDESSRPVKREEAAGLLRLLHTLKAAVKHFHLEDLGRTIHKLESELRSEAIQTDKDFQSHMEEGRKEIDEGLKGVLDQVKDLIGQDYEGKGNMHEVEESALYDFAHEMQAKHADPQLVRRFLSTIVAIPANDCFRQFDRELRDLAEITGKQIKPLRYTGSNPRILTEPIQEFLFALTHICRNIIDHGIEPPVTRLARGKDPAGQVTIHTDIALDPEHKKEWLHIVIADDGNGIDPSKIRSKLAITDPQGAWRNEDDQAIIQYIFSWGISTRENVTDLSGHGVGMEAVEREVKLLGGAIKVYSELYRGTRFDIKIPYIFDLHDKERPSIKVISG